MKSQRGLSTVVGCLLLSATLVGCGVNQFPGTGSNTVPTPVAVVPVISAPVSTVQGKFTTGQASVTGVHVQLYAAGSSGYGSAYPYSAGTSLLGSNTITTDSNGNFDLTGAYACPSASTLVYLVGSGGYPLPGQSANPNLSLMAALGPCGSLSGKTYISVNELTTIASVWALAPFMKGMANVGTSANNQIGLTNAFAAVNKLIDLRSGVMPGPALPLGATLPVAEINTLADILQTCIDSVGGSAGDGSACGTLFGLTRDASGTAPTETITAALNLARNPAQNASALNFLPAGTAAYQPTLGNTPPTAWTLAIHYTAANTLSAPAGMAVDSAGAVWIANQGNHTVVRLDSSGSVLSGTGGYAAGQAGQGALAIDTRGNAWVASDKAAEILMITPTGTVFTIAGGGLTDTTSIAIDGGGQIWAAGMSNALSVFTPAGVPISATGFSGGGLSNGQSIAIGH